MSQKRKSKSKMEIRVSIPNPSSMSLEDWVEQTELAIFHIKKAYEKYCSNLDEEERKNVSIHLMSPQIDERFSGKDTIELNYDEIFDDIQDIEIVMSH